jgi:protein arginine N-methyltransferase 3
MLIEREAPSQLKRKDSIWSQKSTLFLTTLRKNHRTTTTTTTTMQNDDDDLDEEEGEEGDFGEWIEDEESLVEISEQRKTKCLFSQRVYSNAHEALTRAATDFGFDLRRVVSLNKKNTFIKSKEEEEEGEKPSRSGREEEEEEDDENELEFYDVIKVINFVRKMVLEETKNNSKNNNNKNKESDEKEYDEKELAKRVIARVNDGAWKDDVYLMPVDASGSDPLTYEWESYVYGIDDDEERAPAATKEEKANKDERDSTSQNEHSASSLMISSLRSENEALKLKVFEMMEKLGMISEEEEKQKLAPVANVGEKIVVSSAPTRNMNDDCASRRYANDDSDRFDKRTQQEKDEDEADARVRDSDDSYFNSYSYFEIHKDMLSDKTRTDAYRDALTKNPTLMNDANVLDVGCGTGILSMFAARDGGARNVVGVDGSYRIADVARMNVGANDLREKVEIIEGKLEDMDSIRGAPFDVIVSEWMGYGLFFESMLDTVLYARDKYLKPDGALLPDVCCIKIAGFTKQATVDFDFWNDVYGFSMKEVAVQQLDHALATAVVKHIEGKHIGTTETEILRLDLCKCSAKDTEFSAEFKLDALENATKDEPQTIYGIALWFDTEFSSRFCRENPVVLSTSPKEPKTHWVQTALHFPEPVVLDNITALGIKGRISMAKSTEHVRGYDISLESCTIDRSGKACGKVQTRLYRL